jgi:hypothetical protein
MKRMLAICLFVLSTTQLHAAPWTEAIRATKHPVARHYLIASYWSWREAVRWQSPTNRKWALTELDVAIEATKRFDPGNKTALQLMDQIRQEVGK